MAVLAVAIVKDVIIIDDVSMAVVVKVVINDASPSQFEMEILGTKTQVGNLTPQQFLQAIRNAVEVKMTSDYGFSFQGNDTIRVIGAMD